MHFLNYNNVWVAAVKKQKFIHIVKMHFGSTKLKHNPGEACTKGVTKRGREIKV